MSGGKSKLNSVFVVLFLISLVSNVVLVSLYFFKYLPQRAVPINKLSKVYKETEPESPNCKRVYSRSAGKIICLTESMALEMCSNNFREFLKSLDLDKFKGTSIGELEKTREFIIKMCMQEKGFNY